MTTSAEALAEQSSSPARVFDGAVPTDAEILDVTSLGGGLRLISDRRVYFTEALAHSILSMNEFCADRPLRDEHVTYLINAMKRGTFRPEWVKFITCTGADGKDYRMNGQHCAWARLEMPEKWGADCKVGVLHYEADTDQDMRLLYASIDRNAPRTRNNVVASHLIGTVQFAEVPARVVRLLTEGLAFWIWDTATERQRHDGDDVAYLVQTEHANMVNRLVGFLHTDEDSVLANAQKHVRRAAVIAAMYETFSKAAAKSEEFWLAVRLGVGMLERNDPRLKLRNALMSCVLASSAARARAGKRVTNEEMYRWCVHAWNAWRRDEMLTYLRAGDLDAARPGAR